jgi:hypothetical protein
MAKVLILQRSEQQEVELREKTNFINEILLRIGFYESENDIKAVLNMQDLRLLKSLLNKCNIDILDDCNNGIKIYLENKLVAEWLKPRYILRSDNKILDPKKRFYLEMYQNTRIYSEE